MIFLFSHSLPLILNCLSFSIQRDVGVQAIEQLLQKRRNHFDYILLETTGVADPLPIAKMFWLDEELQSDLILDGTANIIRFLYFIYSSFLSSRFNHRDRWF